MLSVDSSETRTRVPSPIDSQVMLVLSDLSLHDAVEARLSVVWKVEDMQHIVFLMLDPVPTVVDDVLETKSLVVLFPTMADKDRVGLGKRLLLKFWTTISAQRVPNTMHHI